MRSGLRAWRGVLLLPALLANSACVGGLVPPGPRPAWRAAWAPLPRPAHVRERRAVRAAPVALPAVAPPAVTPPAIAVLDKTPAPDETPAVDKEALFRGFVKWQGMKDNGR